MPFKTRYHTHRQDANHVEIVRALLRVTCTVYDAHNGGLCDIICAYQGRVYLLEVKTAHGKLTPKQVTTFCMWKNLVKIVRTPEEALAAIGAM